MLAYLNGLRENGEAVRIAVYRRANSVHLSGPHGSHVVHPSREANIEGWKLEASLVWNLTDVYDTHPMSINSRREKEKFELLKARGAERKRVLAMTSPKTTGGH